MVCGFYIVYNTRIKYGPNPLFKVDQSLLKIDLPVMLPYARNTLYIHTCNIVHSIDCGDATISHMVGHLFSCLKGALRASIRLISGHN